jgi:signal transduction histidine kinase
VWPALNSVERAVDRLYEHVTIDLAGEKKAVARVERQDLDELLGNLIENAAKYGNGRVFVTVTADSDCVEVEVEDDGAGIPEADRAAIFDRGARLDTGKPGTGLGLAIVRDVAEIMAARPSGRKRGSGRPACPPPPAQLPKYAGTPKSLPVRRRP